MNPEDEVEISFLSDYEQYVAIPPHLLRMSRLEFDALKLRAAQQKRGKNTRDQANNANATFTLGGNVYTHEYLAWLLSERHKTGDLPTQQQWAEAKLRREKAERDHRDEARRAAEEAAEAARRARANFEDFTGAFNGGGYTRDGFPYFTFTDRGSSQSFFSGPPRQEPKVKGNKAKLADLAGVDWDEAVSMEIPALKKKAMRKCHPDTGGSHDQWLKLTDLLKVMGIPL